jgi:hypothetical protein
MALGLERKSLGIGADPALATGGEEVRDDTDRETDDGGGERGDHVAREGRQVAFREALECVRHRDQRAHQAKGRADADGEAEAAERTPATAFGGLQDFFQPEFELRRGGLPGGVLKFDAIAFERMATATAPIPRLAGEGTERDEHRGNEAEQPGEHGPDENTGEGVEEFAKVIE